MVKEEKQFIHNVNFIVRYERRVMRAGWAQSAARTDDEQALYRVGCASPNGLVVCLVGNPTRPCAIAWPGYGPASAVRGCGTG